MLIPVIMAGFMTVRRYYDRLGLALAVSSEAVEVRPCATPSSCWSASCISGS